MNDWFEWNGVRSTDYGIYVSAHPPITVPAERVKFENIMGRSGALSITEGEDVYDDLDLTVECFVRDTSRVAQIATWLRGGGAVVFANQSDGCYCARIVNQLSFERILRGNKHCSFAVNFRCSPFRYLIPPAPDIVLTVSDTPIANRGTVPSSPKIKIEGSGDFSLTIGLKTMFFENIVDGIVVDTEQMDAFTLDETLLANNNIGGDFLTIPTGDSYVSWRLDDGAVVSSVTITPRWRRL